MSFLFPAFLLGALAVAIPIYLHLSRRDVAPRVPFSDLRFLKHAPMMQSRRRRLRELLLLALRVAALLLLALAFARPFYDPTGRLDRGVTIVALDTSYSMTFPDGFERARAEARDAVGAAPSGHAVGVITFDDHAQVATEPSLDREGSRLAAGRVSPGFGATRYDAALELASSLIGSRDGEVVVVTDLQRAGWPSGVGVEVPSGVEVTVRDIGSAADNLAVTAVELGGPGVIGVVSNAGSRDRRSAVRVLVDDVVVGRTDVTLPSGSTEVLVEADVPGVGVLTFEVDDAGGVAADDQRYLLLDPPPTMPVLVVAEGASRGEGAFYIERALGVGGPEGPFSVRSLVPRDLSDVTLDGTAVVLLVGTETLERAARQRLSDYVADGAGLLIVGSPTLESDLVADLLRTDPKLSLGARREPPGLTWSVTDLRHPIFQPFGDGVGTLGQVRFRQTVEMEAAGGLVLATFSGGAPALVEYVVGNGRALVFGSDLGNAWNDFPRLPTFVPFVHEVTYYLGGYRDQRRDLLVADAPPGVLPEPGVRIVPTTTRRVVLNVDPRESDTSRMTSEMFWERISTTARASMPVGTSDDVVGREAEQGYWWYLIVTMIGVLVVEAWLGRTVA